MIIELHTLWRYKSGYFPNHIYEVTRVCNGDIWYTPRGKKFDFHRDSREFLDLFEMLSADEVLEVTGGIFG